MTHQRCNETKAALPLLAVAALIALSTGMSGCRQTAPASATDSSTAPGEATSALANPDGARENHLENHPSLSGLPRFVNVAEQAGITFRHQHGGKIPLNTLETTGAGCCFLDYNNDGWLDFYLVNSGHVVKGKVVAANRPANALYRNNGNGTFTDVTQAAGVAGRGFGMGCVAADYDGDGRVDLYVYNYGGSVLYHNNGNGTFTDVTRKAGVAGRYTDFAAAAAWGDYNGDGRLDLYVANYLEWDPQAELCHERDVVAACSPGAYQPQRNYLYRNNGDGTFTDVAKAAGVADPQGKGMGVLFCDLNDDSKPDLFVSNDQTGNKLFMNRGAGKFEDVTFTAGVGYDDSGRAQAGMGTDFGDYNGDGRWDLILGTYLHDIKTLYRNDGGGTFSIVNWQTGLGTPTLNRLTFGAFFFDFDNDTWDDIFFANGHVHSNVVDFEPGASYAQPDSLLRNDAGKHFEDVSGLLEEAFQKPRVGRGACHGDFDNDGYQDVLVNNSGAAPFLLHNEGSHESQSGNHWLSVSLELPGPNRQAIGAKVIVEAAGRRPMREARAGASYMASNDPRLHFGLGKATRAERIIIRWPDGKRQELAGVPADRFVTIRQGKGVVFVQPPSK